MVMAVTLMGGVFTTKSILKKLRDLSSAKAALGKYLCNFMWDQVSDIP